MARFEVHSIFSKSQHATRQQQQLAVVRRSVPTLHVCEAMGAREWRDSECTRFSRKVTTRNPAAVEVLEWLDGPFQRYNVHVNTTWSIPGIVFNLSNRSDGRT